MGDISVSTSTNFSLNNGQTQNFAGGVSVTNNNGNYAVQTGAGAQNFQLQQNADGYQLSITGLKGQPSPVNLQFGRDTRGLTIDGGAGRDTLVNRTNLPVDTKNVENTFQRPPNNGGLRLTPYSGGLTPQNTTGEGTGLGSGLHQRVSEAGRRLTLGHPAEFTGHDGMRYRDAGMGRQLDAFLQTQNGTFNTQQFIGAVYAGSIDQDNRARLEMGDAMRFGAQHWDRLDPDARRYLNDMATVGGDMLRNGQTGLPPNVHENLFRDMNSNLTPRNELAQRRNEMVSGFGVARGLTYNPLDPGVQWQGNRLTMRGEMGLLDRAALTRDHIAPLMEFARTLQSRGDGDGALGALRLHQELSKLIQRRQMVV